MANKRPKPEEIVAKLRQVEVLMRQGMPCRDGIRQIGVVEQTYYCWCNPYGGMRVDQPNEIRTSVIFSRDRRRYRLDIKGWPNDFEASRSLGEVL